MSSGRLGEESVIHLSDGQLTDGIVSVDGGVPGEECLRQLHRTGSNDLEVLGPTAAGRRQSTSGDPDHAGRCQRSEPELLREALSRAAGVHTGTQIEALECGSPRLRAHCVEEFTPLTMSLLLGGDLDVDPRPVGVKRGFGDRGGSDGNVGDHLGDDGADQRRIRGRTEQGPGHMTGRGGRVGEHLIQAQIVTVGQLSNRHVLAPWAVGNLIILAS